MGVPISDLLDPAKIAALRAAVSEDVEVKRKFTAKERHDAPTMPGTDSYPIENLSDLDNALQAWGRCKPEDRPKLKRHLLARAKALKAPPPTIFKIQRLDTGKSKTQQHGSGDTAGRLARLNQGKADDPVGMEHKADTAAQVIDVDEETGLVTALVSVTGIEDRVKDIIEPGAYAETIAAREPIGVWGHDDKTWVSRTEDAVELPPGDPFFHGLKTMDGKPWPSEAGAVKVDTRFNLETPHGAAAFSDVKFFQGKTGWSIGYRVTKAHRNPRTGVRRIKKLDWYEYSPVMVGAATQPMTLSVKSLAQPVDADDPTGLVDDAVLEALDPAEVKAYLELKDRVRTAAGANRYGQPIGSVIIPDTLPQTGPVTDDHLRSMLKSAVSGGDEEEVRLIRKVHALPPEKRREALTGKGDQGRRPENRTERSLNVSEQAGYGTLKPDQLAGYRAAREAGRTHSEAMAKAKAGEGPGGHVPRSSTQERGPIQHTFGGQHPESRQISHAQAAEEAEARRAGVKPKALAAAQNHSLQGLDSDDPKFRQVADDEGIDKDDLVEAAHHIDSPKTKTPAAGADLSKLSEPQLEDLRADLEKRGDQRGADKVTSEMQTRSERDFAAQRAKNKPPAGAAKPPSQMTDAEREKVRGDIAGRKAKRGEDEADRERSSMETADAAKIRAMSDEDLSAERARLAPAVQAHQSGKKQDKASMDRMRDVLREKRARAAEKEAGSTRKRPEATSPAAKVDKDKANIEKFPVGSKVRTTVHGIGGRSEDVDGEVVGHKRGQVTVKTRDHGTLSVEPGKVRGTPEGMYWDQTRNEYRPKVKGPMKTPEVGRPKESPAAAEKPRTAAQMRDMSDADFAHEASLDPRFRRTSPSASDDSIKKDVAAGKYDRARQQILTRLDDLQDNGDPVGNLNDIVHELDRREAAANKKKRGSAPYVAEGPAPGSVQAMIAERRKKAEATASRVKTSPAPKAGRTRRPAVPSVPALPAGADSTQRAQHSGRVRDAAKTIAPTGTWIRLKPGGQPYRVSGHTMTSVAKSYNNEKGDKVDVGLHIVNDKGNISGRTTTRITLADLADAVVHGGGSREGGVVPAAAAPAVPEKNRRRREDLAADQRVKDREKLAALNKRRAARGQPRLLKLPDSTKALNLAETPDDLLDAYIDAAPDAEFKRSRASLDSSPRSNWVEETGELPGYIREVARAIHEDQGLPLSRAIPIAIGRIKKWAAGGGGVNADTVAKAQAAVAAWEKLKAKAHAKYDTDLMDLMEAKGYLADLEADFKDDPDQFDDAEWDAIGEVKADQEAVESLESAIIIARLLEAGHAVKDAARPLLEVKSEQPKGAATAAGKGKKKPGEKGEASSAGNAKIVRTQAGAARYGVAIGQAFTEGRVGERGEAGPDTQKAQQALVKLGLLEPRADGSVHGVFGPKTQEAVRKFQKAQGLPVTGELDPKTQASIQKQAQAPAGDAGEKPSSGGGGGDAGAESAAAAGSGGGGKKPAGQNEDEEPAGEQERVRSWFATLPAETQKRVIRRARELLKAGG